MRDLIRRHNWVVNPTEKGINQLTIVTEFFDTGDDVVFTAQKIVLDSHMNSVELKLGFAITPQELRRLADELEKEEERANNQLSEIIKQNI